MLEVISKSIELSRDPFLAVRHDGTWHCEKCGRSFQMVEGTATEKILCLCCLFDMSGGDSIKVHGWVLTRTKDHIMANRI